MESCFLGLSFVSSVSLADVARALLIFSLYAGRSLLCGEISVLGNDVGNA